MHERDDSSSIKIVHFFTPFSTVLSGFPPPRCWYLMDVPPRPPYNEENPTFGSSQSECHSLSNRALFCSGPPFRRTRTYGVLCNTSLNFKNKGFINTMSDLSAYTLQHQLDGFVVGGRIYMLKSSARYQQYLRDDKRPLARC